jgi:COP9 signalosome complex subunit 5
MAGAGPSGGGASTAQLRWELENSVRASATDALYTYDAAEQQAIQAQKPWTKDPHFFKQ